MGKTRNSCESATIEMWGCSTEIHSCQFQQVTLVRYSDQTVAMLQGREPLTLSQAHNRTQIAKTLLNPVPFNRFKQAAAPGRGWTPNVQELIRCVLLLQQHETREYTTNPK